MPNATTDRATIEAEIAERRVELDELRAELDEMRRDSADIRRRLGAAGDLIATLDLT
jgi:hypothetical protein